MQYQYECDECGLNFTAGRYMNKHKRIVGLVLLSSFMLGLTSLAAEVDLSKYDPACGVTIRHDGNRLKAQWSSAEGTACGVEFSLEPNAPLLSSLEIGGKLLAAQVQPVFVLTTGARVQRPGVKYIFFVKPATGKNGPVRQFMAR